MVQSTVPTDGGDPTYKSSILDPTTNSIGTEIYDILLDTPSIHITIMTPLEITTGTIAVANGTFTLATNFWKLCSVDDDLKICLRLLQMITQDINEARRLRNCKRSCMSESLNARVERAIEDLDTAAKTIGKMIEASRAQKVVENSISVAKRVAWVFNGKDRFIAEQWTVNAAHNRLLQVVTSMDALPNAQPTLFIPIAIQEKAVLRSPSQQRALQGKSTAIIEFGPQANEEVVLRSPSQLRVLKGKSLIIMEDTSLETIGMLQLSTYSEICVSSLKNLSLLEPHNIQPTEPPPRLLRSPVPAGEQVINNDDLINAKILARWTYTRASILY